MYDVFLEHYLKFALQDILFELFGQRIIDELYIVS